MIQGLVERAIWSRRERHNRLCFSELKANRVEIRCDSLNKKSRAIPEKLGFKLEGVLESASVAVDGNGLRDMCVFAMTRNTYEKEEL